MSLSELQAEKERLLLEKVETDAVLSACTEQIRAATCHAQKYGVRADPDWWRRVHRKKAGLARVSQEIQQKLGKLNRQIKDLNVAEWRERAPDEAARNRAVWALALAADQFCQNPTNEGQLALSEAVHRLDSVDPYWRPVVRR